MKELGEKFNEERRKSAIVHAAVQPPQDVIPVVPVLNNQELEDGEYEMDSEEPEASEEASANSNAMERAIKELQPNKRAKYDVFASGRGLELFMKVTDLAGSLDPMMPKKLSKHDNPFGYFVISESLVKAMAVQRNFLKDKLQIFN